MALKRNRAYISRAVLRGATESYSRGLTILKGAVPDRAPGLGHMAPTYLCRFPGSPFRRLLWPALFPSLTSPHSESRASARESSAPTSYRVGFRTTCAASLSRNDRYTCLTEFVSPVRECKNELRRAALAKRDALPAPERAAAADTIAARVFPVPIPPGAMVSGYSPMKSELNPVPLMRKLADAGAQLALPVVQGRGQPLVMRAWTLRRAARLRRLGHPRADGRRAGSLSRHHAGAARGLRPAGPAHRLWRGLLRHDHRAHPRHEAGDRHRPRFCRAGGRQNSRPSPTTRPSTSC